MGGNPGDDQQVRGNRFCPSSVRPIKSALHLAGFLFKTTVSFLTTLSAPHIYTQHHLHHTFLLYFRLNKPQEMSFIRRRLAQATGFLSGGQQSPDQLPWNPDSTKFPSRKDLPKIPGAPEGAAWVWGKDDYVCWLAGLAEYTDVY